MVKMVDYMMPQLLASGAASQGRLDAYVVDLKARSERGSYFFCVNRFLFTAVKI